MRVPFLASGNCHMHSKSGRCTKRAKDERGEEKRGKKEVEEAKETEEEHSDSKEDHQDMKCPRKPRLFFEKEETINYVKCCQ